LVRTSPAQEPLLAAKQLLFILKKQMNKTIRKLSTAHCCSGMHTAEPACGALLLLWMLSAAAIQLGKPYTAYTTPIACTAGLRAYIIRCRTGKQYKRRSQPGLQQQQQLLQRSEQQSSNVKNPPQRRR
jgi:hypothetical protein